MPLAGDGELVEFAAGKAPLGRDQLSADPLGNEPLGVASGNAGSERIRARQVVEQVVMSAMSAPPGLPRLKALIDAWLAYVERRTFPGGCFMVAAIPEFDSRPSRVRDALAKAHRDWLALLEREVSHAQREGSLTIFPLRWSPSKSTRWWLPPTPPVT